MDPTPYPPVAPGQPEGIPFGQPEGIPFPDTGAAPPPPVAPPAPGQDAAAAGLPDAPREAAPGDQTPGEPPDWEAVARAEHERAEAAARQAEAHRWQGIATHVQGAWAQMQAQLAAKDGEWAQAEARLGQLDPEDYRQQAPVFYQAKNAYDAFKQQQTQQFQQSAAQAVQLIELDQQYTGFLAQQHQLNPAEQAEVSRFPANFRDQAVRLVLERRQAQQATAQQQRARQQQAVAARGVANLPYGGAPAPAGVEPGSIDHYLSIPWTRR